MKKIIAIVLAAACVVSLASCKKNTTGPSNFGSADQSVYLYSDMSVETVDLEDFDTSRYDVEEFSGILNEAVAEYNGSHDYEVRYDKDGNALDRINAAAQVTKCEAKDNVLETRMLYSSAADMVAFEADGLEERGGARLEVGTLENAPDEVLNAALLDPNGEPTDLTKIIEKEQGASYSYVICDFDALIYGDGSVYALTAAGEYTRSFGCVTVNAGQPVIVIFKVKR